MRLKTLKSLELPVVPDIVEGLPTRIPKGCPGVHAKVSTSRVELRRFAKLTGAKIRLCHGTELAIRALGSPPGRVEVALQGFSTPIPTHFFKFWCGNGSVLMIIGLMLRVSSMIRVLG